MKAGEELDQLGWLLLGQVEPAAGSDMQYGPTAPMSEIPVRSGVSHFECMNALRQSGGTMVTTSRGHDRRPVPVTPRATTVPA
jgi:hypothetical protein